MNKSKLTALFLLLGISTAFGQVANKQLQANSTLTALGTPNAANGVAVYDGSGVLNINSANISSSTISAISGLTTINAQSGTMTINASGVIQSGSSAVGYAIKNTAQSTDNKIWDIETDSGNLNIRAVNDAYSSATNAMQIKRSGLTILSVLFPNGAVGINTSTPLAGTKLDVNGVTRSTSYWGDGSALAYQGTSQIKQSIKNRNMNSILATDYTSGSGATTTGTISASSSTLVVASASDFVNGQGIAIFGAGPAFSLGQPTSVTGTQNGTTGATSYAFKISTLDSNGGIGVPVTVTVANGNASLSTTDNITLNYTQAANSKGVVIWVSISGGAYTYIGYSSLNSFMWTGYTPNWRPVWIPSTPVIAAQADWLVTTINSGAASFAGAGDGTTTLNLASTAGTSVSGNRVQHDETAALNSLNTLFASTGVSVEFPCGTWNITGSVSYTNPNISWHGQGICSQIYPYGTQDDVVYQGVSVASMNNGGGLENFYWPSYNKAAGLPLRASYQHIFNYNNIYLDHPTAGPYFFDINDMRTEHVRVQTPFGYGNRALTIVSGGGGSDYSCCVTMIDYYVNALSTDSGMHGGRQGSIGFAFDGNVATIVSYNSAVSNIEGKGVAIFNDTGNSTNPSFIEMTDLGAEFSNDVGIYVNNSAADIHFLNPEVHASRNANPNVLIGATVHNWSFIGGRVGNAGGDGFYIQGTKGQITSMEIINNSAPNAGGVNQASYGINLQPSASSVAIAANNIGVDYGAGWQQRNPILVNSGAGHIAVTGNVYNGNQYDYEKNDAGYSLENVFAGNSGEGPVPVIASGFGTSPSLGSGATINSFRVNVGTGTPAAGTITLPSAPNGWNCSANDLNDGSLRVAIGATTTSITLTAYDSGGSVTNFGTSDVISVICLY